MNAKCSFREFARQVDTVLIKTRKYLNTKMYIVVTLHLYKELSLYSSRRLRLILTPGRAEWVDLVYEDDAWLVCARKLKEIAHESARKHKQQIKNN